MWQAATTARRGEPAYSPSCSKTRDAMPVVGSGRAAVQPLLITGLADQRD